MLVTFKSNAHADIMMFGDVATSLLKMMGQSGEVPGALRAEDVKAARQALASGLDKVSPTPDAADVDADNEQTVSLSTRAVPLFELLDASIDAGADVIWES